MKLLRNWIQRVNIESVSKCHGKLTIYTLAAKNFGLKPTNGIE